MPDPNSFDGEIKICARGSEDWITRPSRGALAGRGLGVLEMARGIRCTTEHRATGTLTYHVVDAMVSIAESAARKEFITLASEAPPNLALSEDWDPYAQTLE